MRIRESFRRGAVVVLFAAVWAFASGCVSRDAARAALEKARTGVSRAKAAGAARDAADDLKRATERLRSADADFARRRYARALASGREASALAARAEQRADAARIARRDASAGKRSARVDGNSKRVKRRR